MGRSLQNRQGWQGQEDCWMLMCRDQGKFSNPTLFKTFCVQHIIVILNWWLPHINLQMQKQTITEIAALMWFTIGINYRGACLQLFGCHAQWVFRDIVEPWDCLIDLITIIIDNITKTLITFSAQHRAPESNNSFMCRETLPKVISIHSYC